MNNISKRPLKDLGYHFIEGEHLPPGKDEYYLRHEQARDGLHYRSLTAKEIEVLVKNENTSDDWSRLFVTDRFNPELVQRCQFYGMTRIGALEDYYLEYHDLRLPVGLYDSTIVSCDIGSNVVIDGVRYLGHYILGDEVILLNVDEMLTTNYAKFGNGIVKQGEPQEVRIWIEVCNENTRRAVLPFDGMLPGDAFLWAKYRDDAPLQARFKEMVDARFDRRRGFYGIVGDRTIIKDCRVLKDVNIGSDAYIKGANKLKNLTIHSDEREMTQIGEGVELVNGIIGYGCHIFYGVKAVRFLMGPNSGLKYGARLINSILGDNSTISCCEVLNSLIYPSHEQHHNNSFLVAALVLGQSNIAAGATIGSNHNSRANDGELIAGRGFWPGLCVSLKHNSRFASFCLLAKGHYPAELNVPLPFALVSNNEAQDCLLVMPAYWFLYNMYALARNAWKYRARDARIHKGQALEFDALAPDSVEEIFAGLALLEEWTAKAALRREGKAADGLASEELRRTGRRWLEETPDAVGALEILGEHMENSKRPARILKAERGWAMYREMIHFYSMQTLMGFLRERGLATLAELKARLAGARREAWLNVGGQLMRASDVKALREKVVSGELATWDDVHAEYGRLAERYPQDKARHALASLLDLHGLGAGALDADRWFAFLDQAAATKEKIAQLTYESRAKDYQDGFRRIAYDSQAEMDAVLGTIDANEFVQQMRREAEEFARQVAEIKAHEPAPSRKR